MSDITLRPVGFVRNEMTEKVSGEAYRDIVSEIVVEEDLRDCLDGIEHHSHAIIVYWLNRIPEEERKVLKVRPMGDPSLPIVGVFATRSPRRPNPIGLETVEVLGRDGNVLRVKGLDALDGSPVLDIKPYTKHHDSAMGVTEPEWMERVHRGQ
ncbi:MAG: tRNA (N6-threonylcarbamoyladenosine(37)-N6)-methyltransferase TrmO [Thermoplasmata archaeon]|nr:tRNA (N6-threonylcarbamoyladenosine(37)-N6)-methyltransferase TrmO [Thermoplasmata archaeon]